MPHESLVASLGWDIANIVQDFAEASIAQMHINDQIKFGWFWNLPTNIPLIFLYENEKYLSLQFSVFPTPIYFRSTY